MDKNGQLNWARFEHGFLRRLGDSMEVKSFDGILPTGFDYIMSTMVHSPIDFGENQWYTTVKVKGWDTKVVQSTNTDYKLPNGRPILRPNTKQVYYAKGVSDSHNAFCNGKYTIPIKGEYIYKIKGMPIAKHKFNAGSVIPYPLLFLYKMPR